MEIKKFDELILEMNQGDYDFIMQIGGDIRMIIPTFDMSINGNYGEIRINGMVKFHTQGSETLATIGAYMSGLLAGLHYKK